NTDQPNTCSRPCSTLNSAYSRRTISLHDKAIQSRRRTRADRIRSRLHRCRPGVCPAGEPINSPQRPEQSPFRFCPWRGKGLQIVVEATTGSNLEEQNNEHAVVDGIPDAIVTDTYTP